MPVPHYAIFVESLLKTLFDISRKCIPKKTRPRSLSVISVKKISKIPALSVNTKQYFMKKRNRTVTVMRCFLDTIFLNMKKIVQLTTLVLSNVICALRLTIIKEI